MWKCHSLWVIVQYTKKESNNYALNTCSVSTSTLREQQWNNWSLPLHANMKSILLFYVECAWVKTPIQLNCQPIWTSFAGIRRLTIVSYQFDTSYDNVRPT